MDDNPIYRRYRELQEYVGWTDEDAARVIGPVRCVEPHLTALIDDFYAEIQRHPQAKQVFADDAQVARLKVSLRNWLHAIVPGALR